MCEVDISELKRYIHNIGVKQKSIAQRSNMSEARLSLILQGKRKCEAGEYASICKSIGVSVNKFLKPKLPEKAKEVT